MGQREEVAILGAWCAQYKVNNLSWLFAYNQKLRLVVLWFCVDAKTHVTMACVQRRLSNHKYDNHYRFNIEHNMDRGGGETYMII